MPSCGSHYYASSLTSYKSKCASMMFEGVLWLNDGTTGAFSSPSTTFTDYGSTAKRKRAVTLKQSRSNRQRVFGNG